MKINYLQSLFIQKEISPHPLEYQNVPTDEVFKAEYKYGPEEEQIIKKNIIINFFQTLLARLFQSFIYPGASLELDENRFFKTKNQLKAIGGRFIDLKTPDGDTLEAVHLKAADFKKSIERYFYILEKKNVSFNSKETYLTLRPAFCVEVTDESGIMLVPNKEAEEFIEHLEALNFCSLLSEESLPYKEEEGVNSKRQKINFLQSFYTNKVKGQRLGLHSLARENDSISSIVGNEISNPTVIISGGNQTNYGVYKDRAASYLIRGLDVILYHPRGYGKSTGIPTSYKTDLDLETVYQYLSKEKKVRNKDILLHGHCLGGGLSSTLAARRKGINLLLDRSFSKFSDESEVLATQYFKKGVQSLKKFLSTKIISYLTDDSISQKIGHLFARILSLGVVYDNETNLNKIKGNIALVIDTDDEFIRKDAEKKLLNSCDNKTVIHTKIGHAPSWINTEDSPQWFEGLPTFMGGKSKNGEVIKTLYHFTNEFNQFLIKANLYRKVF